MRLRCRNCPAIFLSALPANLARVHILDVGCGEGIVARALAKRGAHAVGIDPTRALITQARMVDLNDNSRKTVVAHSAKALADRRITKQEFCARNRTDRPMGSDIITRANSRNECRAQNTSTYSCAVAEV